MRRFPPFALLVLAALLALPCAASAVDSADPAYAPSAERDYPDFWFAPWDEAKERAGAPKIGKMRGTWDMGSTDLTFDRLMGSIEGVKGGRDVRVSWDHENGKIRGRIGNLFVDLKVEWSSERVRVSGTGDGEIIDYTADWPAKRVDGQAYGKSIAITYNPDKGVDGMANGSLVKLIYSKKNGALNGMFGVDMANLKLENLDLTDFLMHLYIFLH